jgi:DNA modification methylase
LKPKDLIGMPWRLAFALQADGWYLRSDIIWAKPNPMPESVTDRPTKSHEYLFLLSKRESYYYDADAIREQHDMASIRRAENVRNGTPGVGKRADGFQHYAAAFDDYHLNPAGRNKRTVWTIATEPFPEAHFATFPRKLIEPCVLAGSKPGDTVLDPFAGAGTTLLVAKHLNRQYVGIELNPDYVKLMEKRLCQEVLPL